MTLVAYDVNLDSLHRELVTLPANGVLRVHGRIDAVLSAVDPTQVAGAVLYEPNPGFSGRDQFSFRVSDGTLWSNTATITVDISPVNDAPVVRGYDLVAYEGVRLRSQLTATDEDDSSFEFFVEHAPNGLVVEPATGVLTWTPAPEQVGIHDLVVGVRDPGGLEDRASKRITVQETHEPPTLAPIADQQARRGRAWRYQALASDPDVFDTLVYELLDAPPSMTLDRGTGELSWLPTSETSPVTVRLRVLDTTQRSDEQSFSIVLDEDTVGPQLALEVMPSLVDLGGTVWVRLDATDPSGIASVSVDAGGIAVPLDGEGWGSFVLSGTGQTLVTGQAVDGSGNVSTIQRAVGARINDDYSLPVVRILSPPDGAVVTSPRGVVVEVADDHLLEYTLRVVDVGRDVDISQLEGYQTVASATVATFDPTLLENGFYRIELEATDLGGHQSAVAHTVRGV